MTRENVYHATINDVKILIRIDQGTQDRMVRIETGLNLPPDDGRVFYFYCPLGAVALNL